MKVIIAGGRDFRDKSLLYERCDYFFKKEFPVEIVSGCAAGADLLGLDYAIERGYYFTKFPANWKSFGKRAGVIRNKQMAEYADCLIAFWDGQSKGTKNMIDMATEKGLKIRIVNY